MTEILKESTATRSEVQKRLVVPYFDHEFITPSTVKLEADTDEMREIGFTDVMLCVTETDLLSKERQAYLRDAVATIIGKGMNVSADMWGVGGLFGGEPLYSSKETIGDRCLSNQNLMSLVSQVLDVIASLDIQHVFVDEPELKHKESHDEEFLFITQIVAAALDRQLHSTVCIPSDPAKIAIFSPVAQLSGVERIATDPYFPNAFIAIAEDDRLAYQQRWIDVIVREARTHDIESEVWVQSFGVPQGREKLVEEHLTIALASQVGSVAVWAFQGCSSVPDFNRRENADPMVVWRTAVNALQGYTRGRVDTSITSILPAVAG